MPLYEYKCGSCGKIFEVIQKFADEPLKIHPECGGEVVRLFSAPAFHLKGTGWYATDYGKKSNGGDSKSKEHDSKSSDESKSSDTKSKDTKSSNSKSESKLAETTASTTESKPSTPAA